jgi:hypothetical protein
LSPESLANEKTVDFRQHQIEHDQRVQLASHGGDRFGAVRDCVDPVLSLLEAVLHDLENLRVILDKKDLHKTERPGSSLSDAD